MKMSALSLCMASEDRGRLSVTNHIDVFSHTQLAILRMFIV